MISNACCLSRVPFLISFSYVVAIPNHAGNCNVNISAALDKRKKLFVKISLVAAEIIVGVRAHNGIEKFLSRRKECAHSMTANEHTGGIGSDAWKGMEERRR